MNITTEQSKISNHTETISKNGFSRNLAFIIGINNYQNGISSLKTAVNDAKKLVETLREKHGYQVWVCLDEVATLSKLNQLLEKTLPEQVTENDRLLFYFAGHGVALNGDDGPTGYLIPQDAKQGDTNSYLPMTKLHDALSKLPCRHFLGIFDCCFSGAFRWSSTRDLLTTPEVIHKERYDRFITDAAWQIITSSASDQKALDNFRLDTERGQVGNHSPFAAALLEALEGEADSHPPAKNGKPAGDGVITATELYLYLRDTVEIPTEKCNLRQTPGIWSLNKHDKGEYIFLSPGHELNLPPAPPLDESKNPYRGLSSFDEEHSELFFGRSELVEKLQAFVQIHPLTVVLGASGSGKSSLVKAGLIPKLKKETTDKWRILSPIRPGETPFQSLNNALVDAKLPKVELQNKQKTLSESVAVWAKNNPNSKLLIVIDQSEELITLCQNENERKEFFQQILTAINHHRHQLRVVLTLRSDFEPQIRDAGLKFIPEVMNKFGNTVLKNRWQSGRFIVPAMTRAELREAIEKPAETRIMYFQPHDLVEELIDEVDNMPGALPLLSFALSELFLKYLHRQRDAEHGGIAIDRALTQEDYEELGGVMQSLTQRADEEYQKLVNKNSAYEQVIRHVMLRMVALGGGELARRRVLLSELEYPEEKYILAKEVIERFTKARLLVKGKDAEDNSYVEPAHDALVRGWRKLLEWKQKDEENLILQRRLTPAVVDWQIAASHQQQASGFQRRAKPVINWLDRKLSVVENFFDKVNPRIESHFIRLWEGVPNGQERLTEKPSQHLWNGNPYLDVLDKTLNSDDNWLNQTEAEFVRESIVRKQKNSKLRWRIAIGVMLGLSGLTIIARIAQNEAQRQQLEAQKQEIDALRQASEANWQSHNQLDALIQILRAGKILKENGLISKNSEQREEILQTLRRIVHRIRERDRTNKPVGQIVSLTPDGNILIKNDSKQDSDSRLLNPEGKEVKLPPGFVFSSNILNYNPGIIYNPDGRLLVSADVPAIPGSTVNANKNGNVYLWDWNSRKLMATFPRHLGGVKSFSFSPDSKILAVVDGNDNIHFWNVETKTKIPYVTTHKYKNIVGIGFTPDNKPRVTTYNKSEHYGTFTLWNLQGTQLAELHTDPDKQVSKAIFSADGKHITIEYGYIPDYQTDGVRLVQIFLWNYLKDDSINSFSEMYTVPLEEDDIFVTVSPSKKQIATALSNSNVRFWDLEDKNFNLEEIKHKSISISLSADGKQLATASKDGRVGLFNLETNNFVPISKIPGNVKMLSLSADGKKLAVVDQNNSVGFFDLKREIFIPLPNKNLIDNSEDESAQINIKFSPNSNQLAVEYLPNKQTETVKKINLWNLKTNEVKAVVDVYEWDELIFNPNNQLQLLTSSSESENGSGELFSLTDLNGKLLTSFKRTECQLINKSIERTVSIISTSSHSNLIASADNNIVCLKDFQGNHLAKLKVPLEIKNISLSGDGSLMVILLNDGSIKLWRIGDLDDLLAKGCDRVRNYLQNNPNVSESNRNLCN